uniref:PASTA domain-containing protein n=1 Tax=Svornostia abyssi TaxID=2898438 RepID=UPI00339018ED
MTRSCAARARCRRRSTAPSRRPASALRAAGCRVGKTRARYGTTVRKGRVVATLPAAGKRIAATRPVTILVSR